MSVVNSLRSAARGLAASAGVAVSCAAGIGVAPATAASDAAATPSAAIAMANTGFAVQDGVLYGWGDNSHGELGGGITTNQPTPVPVARGAIPDGVSIVQISAATDHTLALGSDGKVYAWGNNADDELGDGTTTSSDTPVAVAQGAIPDGVKIVKVVAVSFESYALGDDGKVYAWGDPLGAGFLGDGTATEAATPIAVAQGQVPDGVKIVDVAVSDVTEDVALIGDDGKAYVFGSRNNADQLGSTDTSFTTTAPVSIPQGAIPSGVNLVQVVATTDSFEALGDDGHAYGWGGNGSGELGTVTGSVSNPAPAAADQGAIPDGVKLVDLASLLGGIVSIGDDGHAYGWGVDNAGQLGNGTPPQMIAVAPVAVSTGEVPVGVKLVAVTGQQQTAAALGDDGNVYTWGANAQGEIGDGTTGSANNRTVPTRVLLPAQTTTTTLTVSGQQTTGQPVTLTATLTPSHAVGTVEFDDGQTVLGTQPVTGGAASLTTSALSVGEHSITASFTPTDPAEYVSSTTAAPLSVIIAKGTLIVGTPTIAGTPQVGGTLTCDPGAWTAGTTFAYQWASNGNAIPGATSATYTPVAADAGAQLTVTVTGSKDEFTTASATSAAVTVTQPAGNTNPGANTNPVGGGSTAPPTMTPPTRKPKVQLTPANDVLKPGVSSVTLVLQFKSLKVGTKLAVKLSEPKTGRKGATQLKTKSTRVAANHVVKLATGKLPAGLTKIRFYETVGKGKQAKLKLVKTETVRVTAKKGKK